MGVVDEAPAAPKLKSRLAALRRERRFALALLIAGCVGLVVAATALTIAGHDASRPPAYVVQAPDSNRDELADALSNAVGLDPFAPTAAHALPAGWVQRYHLPLDDPDLANRSASVMPPAQTPVVYGPGGLPSTFRMTYWDVYAYGRPSTWNESTRGPFDSHLDPTNWSVENTTGIPYAWLIHYKLDPFDGAALDQIHAANVTWTPREAFQRGLDPVSRDGDSDGIADDVELEIGTDPLAFSTDGSGISDGWLVAHHFDPLDRAVPYQDPAHRGETVLQTFQDSERLYPALTGPPTLGGLDPRAISTLGGPIPDLWLIRYGFDPLEPGIASRVIHRATIANATGNQTFSMTLLDAYDVNKPASWNESRNGPWWGGVDPRKDDTDGDGLPDIEEIVGWDIRVGGRAQHVTSDPTKSDTDGDGLTDRQEHDGVAAGIAFPPTGPRDPDTDGDGLSDGQEIGLVAYRGHTLPLLDPTNPDTADQGLLDGAAADHWIDREIECTENAPYEWGREAHVTIAEALFGRPDIASCTKLAPENDLKGSGKPNVLNADVDGDGLRNGWEMKPATYVSSPYAPRPGEPSRAATDPANVDTDGDGLPDGWEVKFGIPLPHGKGWNIDPAKWSSLGDGVSDADEDLVHDSATWYSYKVTPSGTLATEHVFVRTNLESYHAGADPNRRSSSPDGISDAWKIFWGSKYLALSQAELGDVYPGAPGPLKLPGDRVVPEVGADNDQVVATQLIRRYLLVDSANDSVPGCTDHHQSIVTLQGARLTACLVTSEIPFDDAAIAQNATNPYLTDSTGEGVPDAWKAAWSWFGAGRHDRISPVLPGATLDPTGKGMTLMEDHEYGTDPYVADSDLAGVPDAQEVRLGLDPMDPADDLQGSNAGLDSDHDGIPNVQELDGYADSRGELVRTNPFEPDTDHDGLLDGRSLHNVLGRRLVSTDPADAALLAGLEAKGLLVVPTADGGLDVLGEQDVGTDSTRVSTASDGVPDGWDAIEGAKITDPAVRLADYAYGRPAWWNGSLDGVWRWGLLPGEVPTDDHDHDGLNDTNGEDPVPYANPLNVLPRGDPLEAGINASERLARSQAYGDGYRSAIHPLEVPRDPPARAATILSLDPLPQTLRGDGSQVFTGHLRTAQGEPVQNVTVILAMDTSSLVVGAAVTNATGGFAGVVTFDASIDAPAGSIGVPVFGRADGTGSYANPPAMFPAMGSSSDHKVYAWAYNTSWNPLPRQAHQYRLADGSYAVGTEGSISDSQTVTLLIPTKISFQVAASGKVLSVVDASIALTDAWGRAVPRAAIVVEPGDVDVATDAAGEAAFNFTLPDEPGAFTFRASYAGAGTLLPVNANVSVLVTEPTSIIAIAPPAPVSAGQRFAVGGELITSRGRPVTNASVHLKIADEAIEASTDEAGAFRLVATLPNSTLAAPFRVEIVYDGNATLDGATEPLDVPVEIHPRWVASPIAVATGIPVVVSATLVDAGGEPQAGVRFTILTSWGERADGVTLENGTALATINASRATPGEWRYSISEENALQGPASNTQTILVTSATRIAIDRAQLLLGAPAFVRGTLADAQGRALAGRLVIVNVGIATRPIFTGADGSFNTSVMLPSGTPVGPIAVSAAFAGTPDGVYEASHVSLEARVKNAAAVTVPDLDIVTTNPTINGLVTTLLGQPVASAYVEVTILGKTTVVITGSDGWFHAAPDLPGTAELGDRPMTIAIRDEADLAGREVMLSATLKSLADLSVDAPSHFIVGKNTTFHASARDSVGDAVPGVALEATLDDSPVGLEQGAGLVVLHVPQTLRPGTHHLVIGGYSPTFKILPWAHDVDVQLATKISIPGRYGVVAGQGGFLPLMLTSGNDPIRNATLTVTTSRASSLRIETDDAGAAEVPLPPALSATSLRITFAGDPTHGPAVAEAVVHVDAAPARVDLWALLFVASGIALVAGLVWWIRRRRKSAVGVAGLMTKVARDLRAGKADLRILYTIYLELVQLAGVTEEAAETMTFGEVLSWFLGEPAHEADAKIVHHAFNSVLYGSGLPESEWVAVAAAFDRLSAQLAEARLYREAPSQAA